MGNLRVYAYKAHIYIYEPRISGLILLLYMVYMITKFVLVLVTATLTRLCPTSEKYIFNTQYKLLLRDFITPI